MKLMFSCTKCSSEDLAKRANTIIACDHGRTNRWTLAVNMKFAFVEKLLAGWLHKRLTSGDRQQNSVMKAAPPSEAPADPQLDRLIDVVRGSASRGDRALDCHHGAQTQVNAALYELDRLREELAGVIGTGTISAAEPAVEAAEARGGGSPSSAKRRAGLAA